MLIQTKTEFMFLRSESHVFRILISPKKPIGEDILLQMLFGKEGVALLQEVWENQPLNLTESIPLWIMKCSGKPKEKIPSLNLQKLIPIHMDMMGICPNAEDVAWLREVLDKGENILPWNSGIHL